MAGLFLGLDGELLYLGSGELLLGSGYGLSSMPVVVAIAKSSRGVSSAYQS